MINFISMTPCDHTASHVLYTSESLQSKIAFCTWDMWGLGHRECDSQSTEIQVFDLDNCHLRTARGLLVP